MSTTSTLEAALPSSSLSPPLPLSLPLRYHYYFYFSTRVLTPRSHPHPRPLPESPNPLESIVRPPINQPQFPLACVNGGICRYQSDRSWKFCSAKKSGMSCHRTGIKDVRTVQLIANRSDDSFDFRFIHSHKKKSSSNPSASTVDVRVGSHWENLNESIASTNGNVNSCRACSGGM